MADAPAPLYGNSFWQNLLNRGYRTGDYSSSGPVPWGWGNDNPKPAPMPAPPVTTGKPSAQLSPDVLQRLMQYTGMGSMG